MKKIISLIKQSTVAGFAVFGLAMPAGAEGTKKGTYTNGTGLSPFSSETGDGKPAEVR
jgi:hypothetical protein